MKRLVTLLVALAAIPIVSASSRTHDGSRRHSGVNISVSDRTEDGPADCNSLDVTVDGVPAARAEEELPVAGLRTLSVRSDTNGGIHVAGWNQSGYGVTVCKAAALPEDLGHIRASLSGNSVTANGPAGGNWLVYFIVHVPRGGQAELETHNGGISLHQVDATVTARATNGPISIHESPGTIDAQTENGPISVSGDSGAIKAHAQNGPISVNLSGSDWRGSLEAHTENGPLSVKIARDFRSGVLVETDGHGPVSCRAEACRQAKRTWDDDDEGSRRIELGGGGTPNVHMTTVNGPVSIKEN